jgi:aminoglycoside phosphotransferase (APT) family kinase protein
LTKDGRITSVLDWEMAHLGNPIEDLAWWLSPPIRTWVEVPRRFTTDDFIRTYCQASGRSITVSELRYWAVVTMYKMVALAKSAAVEFAEGRSAQPRTAINARRFTELMLLEMERV